MVRTAKRLADLMDAPWLAVTVERPGTNLDDDARQRLDEAMKLAESLGAETQTLTGSDLPAELLRFAKFENVTQIVIGRSHGGFLSELLRRSLPHELVRRTPGHRHSCGDAAEPRPSRRRPHGAAGNSRFAPLPFLYATLSVAAALGVGEGADVTDADSRISRCVFLLAVLLIAMSFGIWPAIFASVLSFLAYNFFFIEPLYTFTIAEPYELLALVIFLVVAVITSALAGRVREQAEISAGRMRAMRRLYEFTRRLSGLASFDAVAEGAASEIYASLGRAVVVLLANGDDLDLTAAWPPEDALDAAPMTAARWAFSRSEPAGADTATLPTVPWYFVPLRIGEKMLGVIGVARPETAPPLDSEARALLDTLSEQTAAALERASLSREMVSARTATETERVRNTLLASISHDFRTPLSSILGSATSLIDYGDKLDAAAKKDLLTQIKQETEGLDEMVRNLLAITRIDAGALELRRDWIDLREIVDRVVNAARRRGARQKIEIALPADLPLVRADATLVEQAIGNVIGNAVAHTPAETRVLVDAEVGADKIVVHVTDDGPGISADALPHIFDKFIKGERRDADGGQGTGLGLAIAKGIMEAHGGSIAAESPHADGPWHPHHLDLPAPGRPA